MRGNRRLLMSVVAVAAAVTTVLGTTPAQADPGGNTKPPEKRTVAKAEGLAPDRVTAPAAPAATSAELTTIQTRIARYVATNGTKYTFASYYDATAGRIVLSTDAPADVVSTLTTAAKASSVQVRHSELNDVFSRRDDVPSFYGGGGITFGGGVCSSGYAVQNSAGTRFMVTAGHCFADGTTVTTESGATTYGTVSHRRLPTVTGHAQDLELIGGSSYAGRIFTGGVTSSTSAPVVAAGTAYVGFTNYCHSGRTTGENCGHTATSITAQVCTQTGCKSPVIAFTGGVMIQGGDSGSPFYVYDSAGGAWIRGHILATDGTTGYAEPYTVTAPELGVSIVTG
ncbi:S1 family peptidase [Winogradskya consettensis]|nr:hypothetical protein [Actinoplanes consettensis]